MKESEASVERVTEMGNGNLRMDFVKAGGHLSFGRKGYLWEYALVQGITITNPIGLTQLDRQAKAGSMRSRQPP